MCGLFAAFLRRPLTAADIAFARRSRDALQHRGPDGAGEWVDAAAGVYLGHRRLAIIDTTAASNQPMVRGDTALTYNGELYNYPALRTLLEGQGRRFQTTGDVEVLLEAWRLWGAAALDHFDGMFAFAVWDGRAAHFAVDPFGEKPLFWAETPDGIYVSSEIQPLLDLAGVRPEMPAEHVAAYLSLGYVAAPATAYSDVHRLRPATVVSVRGGRVETQRTYWRVPPVAAGRGAVRPLSEGEIDRLQEAMSDSVRGRLLADVPMCLFLSAGVDSTLVAAMACRDHRRDPTCVTVSFPDAGTTDESPMARETADYLGLSHRVIPATPRRPGEDVSEMVSLFAQPCDATTALSIRQMTAAVRPEFKVALTGSGGDEVTFGYGKNAHFFRHRRLYGLPQRGRQFVGRSAGRLARWDGRLARLAVLMEAADEERYIAQKNAPALPWLRQLDGFAPWSRSRYGSSTEPLELSIAACERDDVMPNLRLLSMDHASMRSSVELRTPFLSRRVVETVASFDPRALMAFGQKSVTRRLLARYVPHRLIDRPKRGFVFPQDRLLAERGVAAPRVRGIDPALVAEAWANRAAGGGWTRIAVRLLLLSAVQEQLGGPLDRPVALRSGANA